MNEPFELEWFGGVAEKHYRRLRPDVEALPWGTIDKERYPLELVERARVWWTDASIAEYRAAIAFSELLRTMLEAKVPLDIVGMASEFVADEISHVEIASRMAMELGGGAPLEVDTTRLIRRPSPELGALERVNEQVLCVSCIHETFSGSIVAAAMRAATHPLVRGAETLIARDEARHIRLGSVYFEWASEELSAVERARLSALALETLESLAPTWKNAVPAAAGGFSVDHLRELGRLDADSFAHHARECVREEIVPTLARFGIEIPPAKLDGLLAER
jgi:hypothetical protein